MFVYTLYNNLTSQQSVVGLSVCKPPDPRLGRRWQSGRRSGAGRGHVQFVPGLQCAYAGKATVLICTVQVYTAWFTYT